MGLSRLQLAVAELWDERKGSRGGSMQGCASTLMDVGEPQVRQHVWYIVPLRAAALNKDQPASNGSRDSDSSLCFEEDVIDWDAILAFGNGGVPLSCLPSWPAIPDLPVNGCSEGVNSSEKDALFCSLGLHVKEHGVVISMHNGKLHVAEGLEAGMGPLSPFPTSKTVEEQGKEQTLLYRDYFREHNVLMSTIVMTGSNLDDMATHEVTWMTWLLVLSHVMTGSNLDDMATHVIPCHDGRRYGVLDDVHPVQPMLRAVISSGRGSYNTLAIKGGGRVPASPTDTLNSSHLSQHEDTGDHLDIAASEGERDLSELDSRISVHLIPQLVALHPLNLPQWRCLNQMPSLVYRMESILCSHQLLNQLRNNNIRYLHGMPTQDAVKITLSAITGASCGEKHFNLEQLELLGDAVLKYATSVQLYSLSMNDRSCHEGILSSLRDELISNENLLTKSQMESVQLHRFYRARPFDQVNQVRRGEMSSHPFSHPQLKNPDQVYKAPSKHDLHMNSSFEIKGKRLADSVEALIGAHCFAVVDKKADLLETVQINRDQGDNWSSWLQQMWSSKPQQQLQGQDTSSINRVLPVHFEQSLSQAVEFISSLGLMPQLASPGPLDPGVEPQASLLGLQKGSHPELNQLAERRTPPKREREVVEKLEEVLQYKFQDKWLAVQALTHCSYPSSVTESYQRLEFIGDAILGLIATVYVLENRVEGDGSGSLSEKRSQLVCNEHLAQACLTSGLYELFRVGYRPLQTLISQVAKQQKARRGLDAEDQRTPWNQAEDQQELPKVLADCVEAIIGAIFLDSCGRLEAPAQVVHRLLIHGVAPDVFFSSKRPKTSVAALRNPRVEVTIMRKYSTFRPHSHVYSAKGFIQGISRPQLLRL
ncbi:hypothetical protein CEUSTIGMA_g10496.t1 [Chlamydomonas eustigma]|uniref:RNase III domain-containing protein n=1 Tax=Chlamydomonas eustigma TaxID=1157962 RepID=A0A250XJU2_9CHLO|nr:hypothetical protein CEUSTIGMA_g10496.t1 [Chlamydomonas eustigma]|eukprot:GAX83070.1 hypothetical protein CEUSTIGMA_g10496.t1 [Chlamydomonas eustigma]